LAAAAFLPELQHLQPSNPPKHTHLPFEVAAFAAKFAN